ncbi:MAG: hypothetical protein AAF065_03080 [Verrucomicrobiota bacterium]
MPTVDLENIVRRTPMPELGKNRIAKILQRYYDEGLGGPENWGQVESLYTSGRLILKDSELVLNAFQKKPNYIKMMLSRPANAESIILAYDGKLAWQKMGVNATPQPMVEAESRRFIHSSLFGNHLLYPFAEGKTIRYIDTVPVEGTICHQIRVTLDTEYQVDYFIDIRTFLEKKVQNTDLRTNKSNSVIYKDYTREYVMPIARKVDSMEEGKWVSTMIVEEVKVNLGLMPWMFDLPK